MNSLHPPTPCKGTYVLISLGCAKNLIDSERMAGCLQMHDYQLVEHPEDADLAVINTCGFIGDARHESFAAIHEMVELKQHGRLRGVIVAGCLAERNREAMLRECPGIDQLVGVFARDEIAAAADRVLQGLTQQQALFRPAPSQPLLDRARLRMTPPHLAFLKIAEGCSRLCSFCTIPSIRGPYASKPCEQVVAEAEELVADGARELILVAQDTSSYGIDLDGQPQLAQLLARLEKIDGVDWIRLMYLYPLHLTDSLIATLASSNRILPYLDLPLQHINDDVLRRMRRQVNRSQTESLLYRLRQQIPNLVLRTTMIVGFPGETDAQFDELVQFVRQQRFERLGVFAYSDEPDASSYTLDNKIPHEVKQHRRDQLMAAQQEIAFAWNKAQIGRRLDAIIDSDIPGQQHAFVGRTYADAPEVDGVVYITGEGLAPGQIVPCEIVTAKDYDLIGAAVGKPY